MAESPGSLRVLVVDDLAEIRILIRRALSARGYAVDVAASLAEARELHPAEYAAVLIDAHLGSEQGIDLIRALEAENPAAGRRCLLMTGGSAGEIPKGVPYLTKPFKLAELLRAVRGLHEAVTSAGPADAGTGQLAQGRQATRAPNLPPARQARDGRTGRRAAPGQQPVPSTSARTSADQPVRVPEVWRLLELIRLLRARERGDLADFLHDGPIQELTAVSLELQMMSRSTTPDAHARCTYVMERLDAAARSLRWLVDGPWLFQEAETSLSAAAQQRTAWLLATPLVVEQPDGEAELAAADIPGVIDVVELMLHAMMPPSPRVRAAVAVRARADVVKVDLTLTPDTKNGQLLGGAATAEAVSARAALDNLASLLGCSTQAALREQRWTGWIELPRPPLPAAERPPN